MKKILIILLVLTFVISAGSMSIGCKEAATDTTEAEESMMEEESASETEETEEEAMEETEEMAEFDWKKYAGTTIVANLPAIYAYKELVKLLPEFEALTGIKVEVDMLNYMKLHDKQVLEFIKPAGDYDVVSLVCMWKTEYVAGGFLEQLEPYFENIESVIPGFDFDDLVEAYVDNTGRVGGDKIYMGGPGSKLYALPLSAETSLLAYRKDLFEEYDLKVPETYDELREVQKFFFENVPDVYGLTMRGAAGHQATAGWLYHADPFGARVFDDNWEPIFNNEAAIETLEFMKEVVKYGPPGIGGFDVGAMNNSFLQGQAALYLDGDKITGLVKDADQSQVVGKVGYAIHPSHDGKIATETGGFGVGIPTNSQNKDAAFLLIQWMTSKDISERLALIGVAPSRLSIYEDPEMQEQFPEYAVLAETLAKGYADPDWRPIIAEWGEINVQLMGVAINQVLIGEKEPQEAMDEIIKPVTAIMEKAGYYD